MKLEVLCNEANYSSDFECIFNSANSKVDTICTPSGLLSRIDESLIKEHCTLIRDKYFSYEEKKEMNSIISLIDYFVKKSENVSNVVKEEKEITRESSSLFSKIGSSS